MDKKPLITIEAGVNVWPQELETAQAYAAIGTPVHFIRRNEQNRARSADALIGSLIWEMKAPKADNHRAVDRNVRRAENSHQMSLSTLSGCERLRTCK